MGQSDALFEAAFPSVAVANAILRGEDAAIDGELVPMWWRQRRGSQSRAEWMLQIWVLVQSAGSSLWLRAMRCSSSASAGELALACAHIVELVEKQRVHMTTRGLAVIAKVDDTRDLAQSKAGGLGGADEPKAGYGVVVVIAVAVRAASGGGSWPCRS